MANQSFCLLLFVILVVGCDPQPLQTVPVTGTVTINGEPAENVGVAFLPLNAAKDCPGSSGFTDEKGRYELRLNRTKELGAVVGKHRVIIMRSATRAETSGKADELPERYNVKSTLVFTVPPDGTNSADFELNSP